MRPKREQELIPLPKQAGGPFGESVEPWWRRKPKQRRSTAALSFASGLLVFAAPPLHGWEKLILLPFVLAVPAALLAWWWRVRERRDSERLFPELEH